MCRRRARPEFRWSRDYRSGATRGGQAGELGLHLKADNGRIEISAEVPKVGLLTHTSSRDEREILRVVQGVEGVKQVYLDLQEINPYPYEQ